MKPTGAGQSALLLSEVVRELVDLGVSYAVVGALAASFHGVVRSSLDADAVISAQGDPSRVQALISRLRDRGMKVEQRHGGPDDPVDSVIGVTDDFRNRVDLLTGIQGMSSDFLSRTIPAPLLGTTFEMVGAEDFVAMKLFAGSPRDLEDAMGVMKVSKASLDYRLLKELAADYGPEVSKKLNELLQ